MRRSFHLTAISVAAAMCGAPAAHAVAAGDGTTEHFFTIEFKEGRSVAKVDGFTVKQGVKPYKLDRVFVKSWSTGGDADAPPVRPSDLTMKRGTGPAVGSAGIDRLVMITPIKGGCIVGKRYPAATMTGGGKTYTFTDVKITGCDSGAGPEEQVTFVYGKMVVK